MSPLLASPSPPPFPISRTTGTFHHFVSLASKPPNLTFLASELHSDKQDNPASSSLLDFSSLPLMLSRTDMTIPSAYVRVACTTARPIYICMTNNPPDDQLPGLDGLPATLPHLLNQDWTRTADLDLQPTASRTGCAALLHSLSSNCMSHSRSTIHCG